MKGIDEIVFDLGAVKDIWKAPCSPTLTSGDQKTTSESTAKGTSASRDGLRAAFIHVQIG